MKTIAFVAPWYGEKIGGGAEAELRGLVHHLQDAGVNLEVLTTCVESFRSDWNRNFHRPGLTTEYGIPVRRFRVRKRNTKAFDAVNRKLMNGQSVTAAEEEIYCREMINSPDLYRYIREQGDAYSLFVFIPYMFGTTFYGCQIWPDKSVLIPCLHDESYARMRCFQKPFSSVKGMFFNAYPEKELAQRLFGVSGGNFEVMGIGVDGNNPASAEREKCFREKYGIRDPFILYAGRKEAGKRVDELIRFFLAYKQRNPGSLKLVLIGGGEIAIPDPSCILDLGFVTQQEKADALRMASFFCNPSEMESFSFVIMESWLAGKPVLVNGKCAVTKDFVLRSSGGLYYDNYPEFECCVNYLLHRTEIAGQMGRHGKRYVEEHFTWDRVIAKYLAYFERITGQNG